MKVNEVQAKEAAVNTSAAKAASALSLELPIISKMRQVEQDLAKGGSRQRGTLKVNGPLPADFSVRFAQGVAAATGCQPEAVKVMSSRPLFGGKIDEVVFEAPSFATQAARQQASDPTSKLATGSLRLFLVARDDGDEETGKAETEEDGKAETAEDRKAGPKEAAEERKAESKKAAEEVASGEEAPAASQTPVEDNGIDIATSMPYGSIEPFGREDTAQELTESSISESDRMVDQLERAEVAEEKRAVFRALTRLRGAAITSFDGIARSQTGNIDEYSKVNKWRDTHPMRHLAEEESDISKWAFPSADF